LKKVKKTEGRRHEGRGMRVVGGMKD